MNTKILLCLKHSSKAFCLLAAFIVLLSRPIGAQCLEDPVGGLYSLTSGCGDYFNENMADYYIEGVIYLNFHFIRDENGQGNFTVSGDNNANTADFNLTGLHIATGIMDKANSLLKDEEHLDPNQPGINGDVPSPKKIPWRYAIYTDDANTADTYNGIWFWDSDYYDQDLAETDYNELNYNHIIDNYQPYGNKVLDIYFVEFNTSDASMAGYANESGSEGIDIPNNKGDGVYLYNTWKAYNSSADFDYQAFVLNHEVGHVLGLPHSEATSNCSDIIPSNETSESNNAMFGGLNAFSTAFTPCQVNMMYKTFQTSPEREYYVKTDPCSLNSEAAITIEDEEDIEFTSILTLDRNIIIEPGGILTISCLLNMPTYGQIKVKPGGILKVKGGTITSGCQNEMWFGIQVFGDKQAQNGDLQGKLLTETNSTITNAMIGISNPHISDFNTLLPSNGGGGILDLDGTTFLNNKCSIGLYPYKHTFGPNNSVLPYLATIDDCSFITDSEYWDTDQSHCAMQLMSVNGPTIRNSKFLNEQKDVEKLGSLGFGIISFDAGFSLSFIDPPGLPELVRSVFEGYQYGIIAFGGFNNFTYSVNNYDFKENVVGIASLGVDKFKIQNCKFEVGGLDLVPNVDGNDIHEGVSVLTGSAFTIRNNEFYAADNTPVPPVLPGDFFDPDKYGLRILNTGEATTVVRNNSFTDLYIANKAEGLNRNITQSSIGLSYACNENINFNYDFIVQKIHSEDGIMLHQGSSNNPAKNTFTQLEDLFGSDFINGTDWPILYYYYNGVSEQEPLHYYSSKNFFPFDVSSGNLICGTIGAPIGPIEIDSIEGIYKTQDHIFDSLITIRTGLIDEGITSTWISTVNSTNSGTKGSLLSNLSSLAPYTSETLIDAVLGKTSLFNLTEITNFLEENSHFYTSPELRAKAHDLWSISESSLASIFSTNINDLLKLDSKISLAASLRGAALGEILNHYASDTLKRDEIDTWLNELDNIEYQYMLADQAMGNDDFTEAESILTDIGNNFTLTDALGEVHSDYEDWNTLAGEFVEEYDDLGTWVSENESALLLLADNTISKPAANARGLLRMFDPTYDFYWPPLEVEEEIEPRSSANHSNEKSIVNTIVIPNPSHDNIWFNYKVNNSNQVIANISDITGKTLLVEILNAGLKHSLNISNLSSGMYYLTIIDGQSKSILKFIKS